MADTSRFWEQEDFEQFIRDARGNRGEPREQAPESSPQTILSSVQSEPIPQESPKAPRLGIPTVKFKGPLSAVTGAGMTNEQMRSQGMFEEDIFEGDLPSLLKDEGFRRGEFEVDFDRIPEDAWEGSDITPDILKNTLDASRRAFRTGRDSAIDFDRTQEREREIRTLQERIKSHSKKLASLEGFLIGNPTARQSESIVAQQGTIETELRDFRNQLSRLEETQDALTPPTFIQDLEGRPVPLEDPAERTGFLNEVKRFADWSTRIIRNTFGTDTPVSRVGTAAVSRLYTVGATTYSFIGQAGKYGMGIPRALRMAFGDHYVGDEARAAILFGADKNPEYAQMIAELEEYRTRRFGERVYPFEPFMSALRLGGMAYSDFISVQGERLRNIREEAKDNWIPARDRLYDGDMVFFSRPKGPQGRVFDENGYHISIRDNHITDFSLAQMRMAGVDDDDIKLIANAFFLTPEELERRQTYWQENNQRPDELAEEAWAIKDDIEQNLMQYLDEDLTGEHAREQMEQAYDMLLEASEIRMELARINPDFNDYSWRFSHEAMADGEERVEKTIEAIAQWSLQEGRWPNAFEMEMITEQFVDPWMEFTGEFVFDPLNLVPGFLMDDLIDVGKAGVKAVTKVGWNAFEDTFPTVGAFLRKGALDFSARTVGARAANRSSEFLNNLARTAGDTPAAKKVVSEFVNDTLSNPSAYNLDKLRQARIMLGQKGVVAGVGGTEPFLRIFDAAVERTVVAQQDKLLLEALEELISTKTPQQIAEMGIEGAPKAQDAFGVLDSATIDSIKRQAALYGEDFGNIVPNLVDDIERATIAQRSLWSGGPQKGTLLASGIQTAEHAGFDMNLGRKALGGLTGEQVVNAAVNITNFIRGGWMRSILSLRPGFTVINTLDSNFRMIISGGALFTKLDDLRRMVPFVPAEIPGGFSSIVTEGGFDLAKRIADGWSPKGGALIGSFAEGFKSESGNILKKISTGFTATNSAMETVARFRLYAPNFIENFTKAQKLIDVELMRRGLYNDLSEESIQTYKTLVAAAGNNPGRLQELIQQTTKLSASGDVPFSVLIEDNWADEIMKVLGPVKGKAAVSGITNDLLGYINKHGELTEDGVREILDSIRKSLRGQGDDVLEQTRRLDHADQLRNPNLPERGLDDPEELVRWIEEAEANEALRASPDVGIYVRRRFEDRDILGMYDEDSRQILVYVNDPEYQLIDDVKKALAEGRIKEDEYRALLTQRTIDGVISHEAAHFVMREEYTNEIINEWRKLIDPNDPKIMPLEKYGRHKDELTKAQWNFLVSNEEHSWAYSLYHTDPEQLKAIAPEYHEFFSKNAPTFDDALKSEKFGGVRGFWIDEDRVTALEAEKLLDPDVPSARFPILETGRFRYGPGDEEIVKGMEFLGILDQSEVADITAGRGLTKEVEIASAPEILLQRKAKFTVRGETFDEVTLTYKEASELYDSVKIQGREPDELFEKVAQHLEEQGYTTKLEFDFPTSITEFDPDARLAELVDGGMDPEEARRIVRDEELENASEAVADGIEDGVQVSDPVGPPSQEEIGELRGMDEDLSQSIQDAGITRPSQDRGARMALRRQADSAGESAAIARRRMNDLKRSLDEHMRILDSQIETIESTIDELIEGGITEEFGENYAKSRELRELRDKIHKSSRYVQNYNDMFQFTASGNYKRFFVQERYPGPRNDLIYLTPQVKANRWNQADELLRDLYLRQERMMGEISDLVETGSWDELVRRYESAQYPSAAELIEPLIDENGIVIEHGIELRFDDGRLTGIRASNDPTRRGSYWLERETHVDEVASLERSMGVHGEEGWKRAYSIDQSKFDEAAEEIAEELTEEAKKAKEVEVRTARRERKTLQLKIDEEQEELWSAFNETYPGLPRTAGKTYEGYKEYLGILQEAARAANDGDLAYDLYWIRQHIDELYGQFEENYRRAMGLNKSKAHHAPPAEQWSPGRATRIQTAEFTINERQRTLKLLDSLEDGLGKRLQDKSTFITKLTSDQAEALSRLGDDAAELMQQGIDASNYGGEFLGANFRDGAVGFTNRRMLDYTDFNNFEGFIKSYIAPFYMFPARSLPMWAEVMVSKPWLATFYMKYLDLSERTAKQAGFIDRQGRQLTSTRGYLPMPGTGQWINPLSPLSFRFIFPRTNRSFRNEELGPMQSVIKWMYDQGTMFGLTPYPHIKSIMYNHGILDEQSEPRWALIPQLGLIPPAWQRWIQGNITKRVFPNSTGELMTPEVGWKDFLIEGDLLADTLKRIQEGAVDNVEQAVLKVKLAIKYKEQDPSKILKELLTQRQTILEERQKDNVHPEYGEDLLRVLEKQIEVLQGMDHQESRNLWLAARDRLEKQDWRHQSFGYFSGLYPKELTDAEAILSLKRNELNAQRIALNDEALAMILDVDPNPQERYYHYLDEAYESNEGQLADMRQMIGWVTTEEGDAIRDPERRNERLAEIITENMQTRAYYEALDEFRKERDDTLRKLPVGALGQEMIGKAWENYFERVAALETSEMFTEAQRSWFVGYKPKTLVYEDIRNLFFYHIQANMPVYIQGTMGFNEWREQRDEYLNDVAKILVYSKPLWQELLDIEWLDPSMNAPSDVIGMLSEEATLEGYRKWQKDNDTVDDAIQSAWTENYLNKYYEAVDGADDYQLAAMEFAQNNSKPSDMKIMQWVVEEYGNRFNASDILHALKGREVWDLDYRFYKQTEADEGTEFAQWDERKQRLLDALPPGNPRYEFQDEFKRLGGDEVYLTEHIYGQHSEITDLEYANEQQALAERAAQNVGLEMDPSLDTVRDQAIAKKDQSDLDSWMDSKTYNGFSEEQDYYYSLGDDERRAYRKANPKFAAAHSQSFELKEEYADEHPEWAKYYYTESEFGSGGKGSGGFSSSRASANFARSFTGVPRQEHIPWTPMGQRSTLDLRRNPFELGRAGAVPSLVWPPGLSSVVSPELKKEVDRALTTGQTLDSVSRSYIERLAGRHKEHEEFLTEVLRNTELDEHFYQRGTA